MAVKINILVFGNIADIINKSEFQLENINNITELKTFLFDKYPDLKEKTFKISVNGEMTNSDTLNLSQNDNIALLPPFAGG